MYTLHCSSRSLFFKIQSTQCHVSLDVCTESDTFLFVFLVLTISRTARISLTKTENHVEVVKTSKQPERDAKVLFFIKNQGGVKASAGSEMSLVSGNTVNRKGMVWIVRELQSYSAAGGKHVVHQREKKSHD